MRTNETRDRLRKKLSLLVSAKKTTANATTTTTPPPPTTTITTIAAPMDQETSHLTEKTISTTAVTQQPPTLKAVAAAAAAGQATCLPKPMPTTTVTPINTVSNNKTIKVKPIVENLPMETTTIKTNSTKETTNTNNTKPAAVSKEILSLCDHFSELSTKNEKHNDELKRRALQEKILKLNQTNILNLANGCGGRGGACDCHLRGDPRAYSSSPEVYERQLKCAIMPQKEPHNPKQVNKWINETLNFIEGVDKSYPRTADPKKVAKKAKQKLRKEEGKRIAELTDFRQQFHDIYYKEYTDKEHLKLLKVEKMRDKKTIQELEANVKKLHAAKAKIEQSILELIATVKQTNAEFKFAYLPTREQLLNKLKENVAEKENAKILTPTPTPTPTVNEEQNLKVKLINPAFVAAGMPIDSAYGYHAGQFVFNNAPPNVVLPTQHNIIPDAHTIYAPPQTTTTTHSQNVNTFEKPTKSNTNVNPDVSVSDNNRIVTIRRINVPNVPEPQVTVTAKGVTPDKDKLLYTFVNGHLIQSGGSEQQNQKQQQYDRPPPLTKKQMKKESQRLAKHFAKAAMAQLELQQKEEEQKLLEAEKVVSNKTNKNKSNKKDNKKSLSSQATSTTTTVSASSGSTSPATVNETRDNSVSSMNLKQQKKQKQQQNDSNKNIMNNKQQIKSKQQQQQQHHHEDIKSKHVKDKKVNAVVVDVVEEEDEEEEKVVMKQKKSVKRNKVVDNGQFDNNPYRSLHAGESDYESSECEESEIDINKKEVEEKPLAKGAEKNKKKTGNNNDEMEQESDKQKGNKTKNNNNKRQQQLILEETTKTTSNVKTKDKKTKKDNAKNKQNVLVANAQNTTKKSATTTTTSNKIKVNNIDESLATALNRNNKNNTNNKQRNNKQHVVVLEDDTKRSNRNNATNTHKTKGVEHQKSFVQNNNKDKRYATPTLTAQQQNQQLQLQQQQLKLQQQQLLRQHQQQQQQQQNYNMLSQQMQQLRLNTNYSGYESTINAYAPTMATSTASSKYSIMDQLSRGVQVENLALPPGITLTKVDPVKSEQLRQKSESIKNISKPLAAQQPQQNIPMAWNHPGATIIAPPASAYMNSGYTPTAIDNATGIIMLESANGLESHTRKPVKQNLKILDDSNALDGVGRKKARRRRNKAKSSTPTTGAELSKDKTPKMITLRNPMFQPNPNVATNETNVLQQQQQQMQSGAYIGGRSMLGLPIPQALPMDQPAAIIKNENGMFTIRNPALHQAVTNGLAMSGYRQYNNTNYYTPQEAVAESARNAQAQKQTNEETAFSYFSEKSDENITKNFNQNSTKPDLHNNISISCSTMDAHNNEQTLNVEGNQQKCISAIGSEKKNAQQKQRILDRNKTPENTWVPNYLSGTGSNSFFNGFNGFSEKPNAPLFVDLPSSQDCTHMHHSCGDDSPPPKITGFNSTYLDGIPNTGVIRYDDASFLKNLITANNLNNEVSIHNISKSGFNRSNPAYMTPHVDITPIYGRSSSANMFRQPQHPVKEHHLLMDGNQQNDYMHNNTGDYADRLSSYNIDATSAYDTGNLQSKTVASELGLSGLLNSNKTSKHIDLTSPTHLTTDRRRSPPFVFEANARNANKKQALPTNSWW